MSVIGLLEDNNLDSKLWASQILSVFIALSAVTLEFSFSVRPMIKMAYKKLSKQTNESFQEDKAGTMDYDQENSAEEPDVSTPLIKSNKSSSKISNLIIRNSNIFTDEIEVLDNSSANKPINLTLN